MNQMHDVARATVLLEAGAGVRCAITSTVHVATDQRTDLTTARGVVRRTFADHDAPSTLLGVSVLGWPGQLVEVEVVAVLPDEHTTAPTDRWQRTRHGS